METDTQAVYVPRQYRGRTYRGRFYLAHRVMYAPTRRATPPDDFSLLTAAVVCVLGAAAMWLGAFL